MPITHIYNLEFRYKDGRHIASMRLEAHNKKMAKATAEKIAASLCSLLADHYEAWIGYRRESPVEVIVTREPDKHF